MNLKVAVIEIGDVMQSLVVKYPFEIVLNINIDSLENLSYKLNETDKGFEIIDFTK